MTPSPNKRIRVTQISPQGWVGRLLASLMAVSLLVIFLFFFSMLFATVMVLAIVATLWALWVKKYKPQQAYGNTIEGEYTVDKSESTDVRKE